MADEGEVGAIFSEALLWCLRCARLARDDRGAVAVLFALSVAPMTFLVGAALDYSGASSLKAQLQKATDGANLRLCQVAGAPTRDDLMAAANKLLPTYLGSAPYTIQTLTLSSSPRVIELKTRSLFPTSILKVFGPAFAQLPVDATATCYGEPQTFEIALALDNTGSMALSGGTQSKMEALKAAATSFVDAIYNNTTLSTATTISIVPFAAAVAVNPSSYRGASWIDQAGNASYHWNIVQGGATAARAHWAANRLAAFDRLKTLRSGWDWAGCLESLTYPLNVRDGAPTPSNPDSYFVPMLGPDETGDGGQVYHTDASGSWVTSPNSYLDDSGGNNCSSTSDENVRFGRVCKYADPRGASTSTGPNAMGPNQSCTSRPLTRLTANKATLLAEIAAMQPAGNTNIHEGFMWGWRTISPVSVFAADAAAYNKLNNNKIIILMTDGDNTWSVNSPSSAAKSGHSAYGYFRNPDGSGPNSRLPPAHADPTTDLKARAAMDALTLEACANASASPNNVVIYTIGFSATADPIDQQSLNMLRTCAGAADRAYVATDSNALQVVFQKIADNISSLRLSR
jgi:Flp pilus assembly protein TadG